MTDLIAAALGMCLSACGPGAATAQPPGALPEIRIAASPSGAWRVDYELDAPVTKLVFARSTDASRVAGWTPGPEFEIVATEKGEIARRRDGAPFTAATFEVAPVYVELPKDYAPFSPFGDGGMLFHSGRFFACAEACDGDPQWPMRLSVPQGRSILLDGRRLSGEAAWTDNGSGRNIYVGDAQPVETPHVLAVLDNSLPPAIHGQLVERLPFFMRYFAARMGELPEKPMLFASYDLSHVDGVGRQGGTLPGQVFMHFYGSAWPQEMAKPDFGDSLTWHFAHEAGHLYLRQVFSPKTEDAWIHEGAAEALAALALRDSPATAPYVATRIAEAGGQCARDLGGKTIQSAIGSGSFNAAYSCGLLLNLHIDAEIRRADPASGGLYAVWRDYIATAEKKGEAGEADYLASVRAVGGEALAETLRETVRAPQPDLAKLVPPAQ